MIQNIFSIQDTKSKTFNPPFYQKNHGEACRTFSKIVNDKNSMINQFPEDFVLMHLGQFDDDSGELIPVNPTVVGTASQYMNSNIHVEK